MAREREEVGRERDGAQTEREVLVAELNAAVGERDVALVAHANVTGALEAQVAVLKQQIESLEEGYAKDMKDAGVLAEEFAGVKEQHVKLQAELEGQTLALREQIGVLEGERVMRGEDVEALVAALRYGIFFSACVCVR